MTWHLRMFGENQYNDFGFRFSDFTRQTQSTRGLTDIFILLKSNITNILLITGLIMYLTNYTIGWLLHLKKITMSKRTHQFFFALIIINLSLLLFFLKFLTIDFILVSGSLISMLALPFGKKGGKYHIAIATFGILFYLILILNLFP